MIKLNPESLQSSGQNNPRENLAPYLESKERRSNIFEVMSQQDDLRDRISNIHAELVRIGKGQDPQDPRKHTLEAELQQAEAELSESEILLGELGADRLVDEIEQ